MLGISDFMADVETPAAESSPAAEPAKQETPKAAETFSVPTNVDDYAKWKQSGELPKGKPSKSEDSAPSEKSSVTPDSEPGAHKRQGNADTRKQELNEEIRGLIARRDELKREIEGAPPEKKDVKRESSTAQPAQPEASKRPVKPKQDDFKTWDEFDQALDKYTEDLSRFIASEMLQEHIQKSQQAAQAQAMQLKLDDAKSRYGEEAEPKVLETAKSVFEDQKIAPAIKTAIGRSDVMVDALYVMGSDQGELKAFIDLAAKDPLEALRKWFTVEALVRAELEKNAGKPPASENGTPPRGEDGKFLPASKPPAKTQKTAPAPATELGANSSPPGDIRDRAAASGDVRAFMEEGNRRDFARWKGQL